MYVVPAAIACGVDVERGRSGPTRGVRYGQRYREWVGHRVGLITEVVAAGAGGIDPYGVQIPLPVDIPLEDQRWGASVNRTGPSARGSYPYKGWAVDTNAADRVPVDEGAGRLSQRGRSNPVQSLKPDVLLLVAALAAMVSCSNVAGDPHRLSVLYSNRSSPSGTAVITWLTPATATTVEMVYPPCPSQVDCSYAWYGPGFRADTVYPNQQTCVHFVAPSAQVAVEARITWQGSREDVPAGHPTATWSSASAWGFDGTAILPAGSSYDGGKVMQGC